MESNPLWKSKNTVPISLKVEANVKSLNANLDKPVKVSFTDFADDGEQDVGLGSHWDHCIALPLGDYIFHSVEGKQVELID